MNTYPMLYTDNASSWRRMMMLARFYWPGMRPGFIVCAVVPFLVFIICTAMAKYTGTFPEMVIVWSLSLTFYLSPLMLTRRDYRELSSQLPVPVTEKIGFLYLTFGLVVPIVIIASGMLGQTLGVLLFGSEVADVYKQFEEMLTAQITPFLPTGVAVLFNCLTFLSVLTIVMYFMVKARRNRVLAAVLALIITIVSIAVVSGIVAAVVGFIHGWNAARGNIEVSDAQIIEIVNSVVKWVTVILMALTVAVAAFFYRKLYKRLRNSGF